MDCTVLVLTAVVAGAPEVGRAQASAPAPLDVVLFVDDLHLDFRDTPRTRDLVKRLVADVMQPGDEWAVVTTGTSVVSQPFTADKALVASLVRRVAGNRLLPGEVLADLGRGGGPSELNRRAEVARSTAIEVVRALNLRRERPSAILYFTSGYDLRVGPAPTALIAQAQRTQIPIHVLDPRDVRGGPSMGARQAEWDAHVAATRDSVLALAAQTGGVSVFAPSDLDHLLAALGRPGPLRPGL